MVNLKHIGIYVNDIEKMASFYKTSFGLKTICERQEDTGELYEKLFNADAKVLITKMITEYGVETGQGEMLELIKVTYGPNSKWTERHVQDIGLSHISFGVDDISKTVANICNCGGCIITDIININQKKCCFCKDIEGNVIEIIQ